MPPSPLRSNTLTWCPFLLSPPLVLVRTTKHLKVHYRLSRAFRFSIQAEVCGGNTFGLFGLDRDSEKLALEIHSLLLSCMDSNESHLLFRWYWIRGTVQCSTEVSLYYSAGSGNGSTRSSPQLPMCTQPTEKTIDTFYAKNTHNVSWNSKIKDQNND